MQKAIPNSQCRKTTSNKERFYEGRKPGTKKLLLECTGKNDPLASQQLVAAGHKTNLFPLINSATKQPFAASMSAQ
jgi:hypothetical protein